MPPRRTPNSANNCVYAIIDNCWLKIDLYSRLDSKCGLLSGRLQRILTLVHTICAFAFSSGYKLQTPIICSRQFREHLATIQYLCSIGTCKFSHHACVDPSEWPSNKHTQRRNNNHPSTFLHRIWAESCIFCETLYV
jgi:hypothetical protein